VELYLHSPIRFHGVVPFKHCGQFPLQTPNLIKIRLSIFGYGTQGQTRLALMISFFAPCAKKASVVFVLLFGCAGGTMVRFERTPTQ
jgi:hypothetical protein